MSVKIDPETAVMDLPRRDARDKLTGRTRYMVDMAGSDALRAVIVRAKVASAKIVRLDVSAAARMRGVRAIATAADAPELHGIGIQDQPLFARDRIRYPGEPICAIAADTLEQARAAADAVLLELEDLPACFSMADALAPDAPILHPDWKNYECIVDGVARAGNIAWEAKVLRGDVDAAFARPDVTIVESCFRVGRQSHMPFEPRGALASYEDGRYHIITSTQVPWTVRAVTAKVLGVHSSLVRVTVPPVGGAFGLKFDCSIEPMAAILSRKTGRSVSLVNSREEETTTCLCRENADIWIRSAITPEGTIAGREGVVLMDAGAYGGEQVFLSTMTAHTLGASYRLGAARFSTRVIYTNTPPNGAFRSCNGAYNAFALERHTDEICQKIGMDPMAFRKKNVLRDQDLGSTGQVFEGDVLGPMLERMEALRASTGTQEHRAAGRLYGRATTVGTWNIFVGPSTATVNLNADGSATLITASVEIGSGSITQGVPQIVAANLGIHPSKVIVKGADTDAAGYDMGTGGGRTVVSMGSAATAACAVVRKRLLETASELLQTKPENLVLRDGRVEIEGRPGSGTAIETVIARAEQTQGPISGSGSFTAPGTAKAMPGCAAGHFFDAMDLPVFVVHEGEVAVDPETGEVEVLAYRVVQDVGRAINPRAVRGQIQGAVIQGIGYGLHEQITIGPSGAIEQTGFETYHIPLAQDAVKVDIDLFEGAPSCGPLGTKGVAEVAIMNGGATMACAIANATGKKVQQLPLVASRVLGLVEGFEEMLEHPHISRKWSDNILK
ncbi:CO or xanthine dehydrogenase, Mo-binding subunit [Arboricoccus pini]|uniref:CO or xanthine dehydrogenase, Mo-binding subunit n=1 Tax=Arboricoccus pini TaxID=1963835 RepID=A0A212Q120_9PROT|nr:xanthine dehydrogenase family protein molybdopterin-binding subunit [Arboricoccus pini]SNB52868.1 CO or xanthine dehydrogenase, Mo-binding subunit [Arboricoccus pini]